MAATINLTSWSTGRSIVVVADKIVAATVGTAHAGGRKPIEVSMIDGSKIVVSEPLHVVQRKIEEAYG